MMDSNVIQARFDSTRKVINNAKRMIWVTFQREGIHRFPGADKNAALATNDQYDVSFLANLHRHIFHIKVAIEVVHSNRDIEFIQFKRWIEESFKEGTMQLDHRSCEMVADELYLFISARYPNRDVEITVAEDGENGATIYYNKL